MMRSDTSVEYLKTLVLSPKTLSFNKYLKAGDPPRLANDSYFTPRRRRN